MSLSLEDFRICKPEPSEAIRLIPDSCDDFPGGYLCDGGPSSVDFSARLDPSDFVLLSLLSPFSTSVEDLWSLPAKEDLEDAALGLLKDRAEPSEP